MKTTNKKNDEPHAKKMSEERDELNRSISSVSNAMDQNGMSASSGKTRNYKTERKNNSMADES